MKTKMKYINVMLIMAAIVLHSCKANLLPSSVKKNTNQIELEEKGKALLEASSKAQGFDHFNKHEVYEFVTEDHWQGPMAGMGKLWSNKKTRMLFRYVPNTFDATVEFLDGKKKNKVAGLQSWNYYEKESNQSEANFNVKSNARYIFGMAAFQYFTEISQRLSNAPIIRYAGEKQFKGTEYELVYVTWESIKPNKDYDQYIVYINKNTKVIEYLSYTLRDNYLKMPGAAVFYGTVHFDNYQEVDGFMVPFEQYVFLGKPKKNDQKYIHKLTLESFQFDGFDAKELYPNSAIESIGDSK